MLIWILGFPGFKGLSILIRGTYGTWLLMNSPSHRGLIRSGFFKTKCVLWNYLVVGDGSLSVAGKLHQRAEVSAQVRFTAHQQHLSVGAELLDFTLPLWRDRKKWPFSHPGHCISWLYIPWLSIPHSQAFAVSHSLWTGVPAVTSLKASLSF